MIEVRKDYVLDRWSYIALDRSQRPQETETMNAASNGKVCFFCPGNENLTPPEIGRVGDEQTWQSRWFPNKFPAVAAEMSTPVATQNQFWTSGGGYGIHEVIAEGAEHQRQLAELSAQDLERVLRIYQERIGALETKTGIAYVQIFKNSGLEAGASLAHTHSQIIALPRVPGAVEQKVRAVENFSTCPYCEIIPAETQSERLIFENDHFAAFTAFAPRFNYEALVFPKQHQDRLDEMEAKNTWKDLAEVFHRVLNPLGKMKIPYNFYLHYAPQGKTLHWHFEITPRLNLWAGFELATDSFVISTAPEAAAQFYRE